MISARERKTRILDVAAELFATRGFSGTGVDEIGDAVGVTGPALYRHFANKQAILDEICLVSVTALLDDARSILEEGLTPELTLERLVEMRVAFAFGRHRHAFTVSHASDSELSVTAQRKVSAIEDLYRAEWIRVLTQVRPSASTPELQVAWFASHILIGYTADRGEMRDETEHRRHLKQMALAVLLSEPLSDDRLTTGSAVRRGAPSP